MSIDIPNETTLDLDELELVACSRFVMEQMRVHPRAELCIRLVDEATMTTLHEKWMDLPGPDRRHEVPDGRADAGARGRATEPRGSRRHRAVPLGRG